MAFPLSSSASFSPDTQLDLSKTEKKFIGWVVLKPTELYVELLNCVFLFWSSYCVQLYYVAFGL